MAAAAVAVVVAMATVGGPGEDAPTAPPSEGTRGTGTTPDDPTGTSGPGADDGSADRSATTDAPGPPAADDAAASTGATATAAGFPSVHLLAGAERLAGRVALAPWPVGGDEALWVLDGGRAVARFDVPTHPGDWPYPLLFAGDGVVFTGGDGAALRMAADGTTVEPLVLGSDVRYVVAGAQAGDAWAIHSTDGVPSAMTRLDDGIATDRHELAGLWWIEAGVGDGVVGRSARPTRGSDLVYVDPMRAPVLLEGIGGRRPVVLAAGGDLLAVRERGRNVMAVIDVRTGARVADIPDATEPSVDVAVVNRPGRACFSPDGRYLAYTEDQPAERVTVVDLVELTAPRLHHRTDDPVVGVSWTADRQLLVAEADALSVVDVPAMDAAPLADLHGARSWWIAADASTC